MSSNSFFPCDDPMLVLIGPTAIGKTALSIALAREFGFEIISVDSMQVYRYMDIGTAKIKKEEMEGVRHHLISIVNPDDGFDAVRFERSAIDAISSIKAAGNKVLLTGGTGLYLKALLDGLSEQIPAFPEIRAELLSRIDAGERHVMHEELSLCDHISASRVHVNDTQRLVRALEIFRGTGKPWSRFLEEDRGRTGKRFTRVKVVGLTTEREKLYSRIEKRTKVMLDEGLETEVRALLKMGYGPDLQSMRSIGYSHMLKYIGSEWGLDEMTEKLIRDTRRYAKRQYTWFKAIPGIEWVESDRPEAVLPRVRDFLAGKQNGEGSV